MALKKNRCFIIAQKGGRISPWSNYKQLNSRTFSLKQHNTDKNRCFIIAQRRGRISPYSNYEQLNSRMFSLKQHNTNHNIKYRLEIWDHIQVYMLSFILITNSWKIGISKNMYVLYNDIIN